MKPRATPYPGPLTGVFLVFGACFAVACVVPGLHPIYYAQILAPGPNVSQPSASVRACCNPSPVARGRGSPARPGPRGRIAIRTTRYAANAPPARPAVSDCNSPTPHPLPSARKYTADGVVERQVPFTRVVQRIDHPRHPPPNSAAAGPRATIYSRQPVWPMLAAAAPGSWSAGEGRAIVCQELMLSHHLASAE